MITLTSSMLTAFSNKKEILFNKLILYILGAVVAIFITVMAIYMIFQSTKKIKELCTCNNEKTYLIIEKQHL